MKKFLLGMLTAIIINSVANYIWINTEKGKIHNVSKYIVWKIMQGEYITDPIMGNCRDKMGENGFGWKFNVADYYDCDRFQRLLNWNFKSNNTDSPKF